MIVHSIHHINIRAHAAEVAQLKDFYCTVLGLAVGWRPEFAVRGYWLYASGEPIVHLAQAPDDEPVPPASQRTALNHVAFRCGDLPDFLRRLQDRGIEPAISLVPTLNITQVLIHDPVGNAIELSFDINNVRAGSEL